MQHHHKPAAAILKTRRLSIIILQRCPICRQQEKKLCGQQQVSYTPTSTAARGGTEKDGHIHLADWTLSAAPIGKKKKNRSREFMAMAVSTETTVENKSSKRQSIQLRQPSTTSLTQLLGSVILGSANCF